MIQNVSSSDQKPFLFMRTVGIGKNRLLLTYREILSILLANFAYIVFKFHFVKSFSKSFDPSVMRTDFSLKFFLEAEQVNVIGLLSVL